MDSPFINESLRSVIGPAAVGVVLLLALWRPIKRNVGAPKPWQVVLGLLTALIGSQFMTRGLDGFWPGDTTHRFPHAVAAAALVAAVCARRAAWLRVASWLTVATAAAWALAEHKIRNGSWEGPSAWAWPAAWGTLLAAVALSWDAAADARPRWTALIASFAATGASVVVAVSGSASLSQLAGAVAAFSGMLFGIALLRPTARFGPGAAGLAGFATAAVVLITYVNLVDPFPRGALGLAAVALLLPGLGAVGKRVAASPPWARRGLELLALATALGVAVAAAAHAASSGEDAADPYGDYGY